METVTCCTHELVRDSDGQIITQHNNILIRNKDSNDLLYVPFSKELAEIFGFYIEEEIERNIIYDNQSNVADAGPSSKWTTAETLKLIDLYKKYEQDFISTTIRNDVVYKKIASELASTGSAFTSTQCKDKFKYLKLRYMKWKDNKNTSGAAPIQFEFCEEMDAIFGNKSNVVPSALASSRKINVVQDNIGNAILIEDEEVEQPKKKARASKADVQERRHRERLDMQQKAIDTFERVMNKLIEKLE